MNGGFRKRDIYEPKKQYARAYQNEIRKAMMRGADLSRPMKAWFVLGIIAVIIIVFTLASHEENATTPVDQSEMMIEQWEQEHQELIARIQTPIEVDEEIEEEKFLPEVEFIDEPSTPEEIIRWEGQQAGLQEYEIQGLINIAWCESRHVPNATNSQSSASGLFQIIKGTWESNSDYPWSERYDPTANTQTAIKIYQRRGLQPWEQCL